MPLSSKKPPKPVTPISIPVSSSTPVPRKPGRPSSYTEELGATICARIAAGESLRGICREPGMPDAGTVLDWCVRHPEFRQRYARAREEQAEHYSSEIIAIADAATPEDEKVARLKIDARKWIASKLLPRVYGDRVAHQVEARVETTTTHQIDLGQLTVEELQTLLALQQKLLPAAGNEGPTGAVEL